MRIRTAVAACCVLVVAIATPELACAQAGAVPLGSVGRLSMDDAVRLALERNQTLRATRLQIDASKADEITAGLKPNLNLSFSASGLPLFSPSRSNFANFYDQSVTVYDTDLSYTFERGGKRDQRMLVAREQTGVTAQGVTDAERQLRFQTEQAFISVLLAKSTLDLTRQDLDNFSNVIEINRARMAAGDLSEGDFLKISIQRLQFETDVSSAQVQLTQARATLRQLVGYEAVTDDFDVTGELTYTPRPLTLDELKATALASRPDLIAAQAGVRLAQDQAALERSNRARDVTGTASYAKTGLGNTVGLGVSIDLPFHDRNQGNIAHADVAVHQANETDSATRIAVLTDVTSAFAVYETGEQVLKLYQSGYLDQAQQSLDVSTYAFQRGAASLLDLLDAERTYRETQLGYRQALAACLVNARQLNLVVGKQVLP